MGLSSSVAGYGTLGLMALNALAGIFAMFTTQRFGMRRTWLGTNGIMIISLSVYFACRFFVERNPTLLHVSMISLTVYVVSSNLGVIPITYMFAVEYQKAEHRGFTQALGNLNLNSQTINYCSTWKCQDFCYLI